MLNKQIPTGVIPGVWKTHRVSVFYPLGTEGTPGTDAGAAHLYHRGQLCHCLPIDHWFVASKSTSPDVPRGLGLLYRFHPNFNSLGCMFICT